jgi:hypothetical protein
MYLFQIVAHLEKLAASNPDLKTKVFFTCICSRLWQTWRSWQPLILTSRLNILYMYLRALLSAIASGREEIERIGRKHGWSVGVREEILDRLQAMVREPMQHPA